MKLDFNILWIEDQPADVRQSVRTLRRLLRDLGFVLDVQWINGFDQVTDTLKIGIGNDVDLILVDYDLGNSGGNGGDAALAIRDVFKHREMVFYSGKSPADLRKVALENRIDGVYFAHRPTFTDDVFGVIKNMLRKIVDLSHMRGIIMAETSELDYLLELSLQSAFDRLDEKGKAELHAKAIQLIRDRAEKHMKTVASHESPETFPSLLGQSLLMTNDDKLRALIRHLKSATDIEGHARHRQAAIEYKDNFQSTRNIMAHGYVIATNGRKVFKGRDREIDEEQMRIWRQELIEHKEKFTAVAAALGANLDDL